MLNIEREEQQYISANQGKSICPKQHTEFGRLQILPLKDLEEDEDLGD